MFSNLLIAVIAVLIFVGFLVLGRKQIVPSPIITSTQGVAQQVPAELGSDVEEAVVKKDGDSSEEKQGATMEAGEIAVEGGEFYFSPKDINIKAGRKVKLTLNNTGYIPHDFVVEGLDIRTSVIEEGESETIEFTIKEKGTYAIYCSVSIHRPLGMEGTLNVE